MDVNATGGIVKLELSDEDARVIQVQLSRDVHDALAPKVGERMLQSSLES